MSHEGQRRDSSATRISRRAFLTWSAAAGGTAALASGLVACAETDMAATGEGKGLELEEEGEWVGSPCWNSGSCLQNCLNQSLIKDGLLCGTALSKARTALRTPCAWDASRAVCSGRWCMARAA